MFVESEVAPKAANYTLSHLPSEVEVIFLGEEVGLRIKTGGTFTDTVPNSHPCSWVYDQYGVGHTGHVSFDPPTILMGVRGVPSN